MSSEEINKIIKKQQHLKKNTPQDVNLNEYKIIKNTVDMEEGEALAEKNNNSLKDKEFQDLHKEVINLHVDDEKDGDNIEDNIEELKASIMDHN